MRSRGRAAAGLAATVVVLALTACGASTPPAEELQSLAAQGRLLARLAADGDATGPFVDVQTSELAKEVEKLSVPEGEAHDLRARLQELLARLPDASRDDAADLETAFRRLADDAGRLQGGGG